MRRLLFAAVAAALALSLWLFADHRRPGPLRGEIVFVVPPGTGILAIGRQLTAEGAIYQPYSFLAAAWITGVGHRLRAGEYAFGPGMSEAEILAAIVDGRSIVRRLTIPEGLATARVLALIADAEGLMGDVPQSPGEGTLLPETYYYTYGDTRAGMVARMKRAMDETAETLWRTRAPDLPLGSPGDAIILASIVEKETGLADERNKVAAVFINRLRRDLPLESDPTVVYAVTHGTRDLGRKLTAADLAVRDAYNTYLRRGLPPGPIANPGRAALQAVLDPAATDALYFVADGSGGHVFSRTLKEHKRNVAKWRAYEKKSSDPAPARPVAGETRGMKKSSK